MPHEVIMPALGMAQETGKIVAWLKAEGDAVAAGDPIMEVETDKATMEVEAQVAGFLIDIRAQEGDDVPVGNVIAMIGASTDEASEPAEAPANADAPTGEATPPDGLEVIMPALGMAQESGKVVGWLKAPGDAVAEGEPLLEVETDKATMEVEAQGAGFLSVTYAAEGDDVPVGEVIAVITAAKPDAPQARARAAAPAAPAKPDTPPTATPPAPARAAAAPTPAPAASGRILASPKARRLAAERGIDLAQLVASGVAQPIHVADLDVAPAPQPAGTRIEAAADAAPFDALATLAGGATGPLLAALLAPILRDLTGADRVAIQLDETALADPDRVTAASPPDTAPSLRLVDLTERRITALPDPGGALPVLTAGRTGATLTLALALRPGGLAPDTATTLLERFAERLEDPLRHLL